MVPLVRSYVKGHGGTNLFCTMSLPADPFWFRACGLYTPLLTTFRAVPRRRFVVDHFFRYNRIMTHLMPTQIAPVAKHNHVLLRAMSPSTSLAQRLFLCPLGWCSFSRIGLRYSRYKRCRLDNMASGLGDLGQLRNALSIVRVRIASKLGHSVRLLILAHTFRLHPLSLCSRSRTTPSSSRSSNFASTC